MYNKVNPAFGILTIRADGTYMRCNCDNPEPVLIRQVEESTLGHMNGDCPKCKGQLIFENGQARYRGPYLEEE